MKKVNQHPRRKINHKSHSTKVKTDYVQTSRKDDAAGSLGKKETDMRLSFTKSELASI